MRKTDRLFEIIQILLSRNKSVTAEALAEELEVSKRTIYRDIQTLEAIVVGLNLLARTGDRGLQQAATSVANKIESVREKTDSLIVSDWGVEMPENIDVEQLRGAIRQEQKLRIHYRDDTGKDSQRRILPIAMVYYIEVVVLAGWCELHKDFRHFRVDRIEQTKLLEEYFKNEGKSLRQQWHALSKSGRCDF